jgi:predicted small lipoprotein YifL
MMRTFRSILILAILGVALSACSSSGSAALPPPAAAGGTTGTVDRTGTDSTAGGPVANDPGIIGAPAQGDSGGNPVGAVDDARIIRTGSMDLEVSDVQAAVKAARSAVLAMGGYVGASNAGTNGDTPFAEISYRIPADRWEDALAELRVLGGLTTKIVSEQTQAVEVTAQVVDLEARIRNLQASETALQGIAAKATKISDVLEIEAQLTSVRGEIEQLMAQLKDLNDRASYATLSARYTVPIVAVQVATKDWQPGTAVDQASASLISSLQGLTDAGIWFVIVWLPILFVLAIVAGIGFAVARRIGLGRRGMSPPAPPAPPAPPMELPAAG